MPTMERNLGLFKRGSFKGGVHPAENKRWTETRAVEKLPIPPQVIIPVQQHIGALSRPVVAVGDKVRAGDPVSEASGFVSVPAHASVSGTVAAIEERPHPLGMPVLAVVIKSDGDESWNPDIAFQADYLALERAEMINRIRAAGLAGMGGAAFPTHVKLSPPADKPVDTVLLNGAECEPYLTSDHRLMLEKPAEILLGLQLIVKLLGAKQAAIGIENNKPDAVKLLRKKAAELNLPWEIIPLKVKYPQGAEKQLIRATTGRVVPAGGLPMEAGCVVQNVGTAAAVYDAVAWRRPLVERIVTVTGKGVREPKNLLVRIGTPYSFVLEHCGGLTEEAGKLIMGGPMMGLAQSSLEAPVIKGTSGLLVLDAREGKKHEERVCISCAHCVDACPMGLVPKQLAALVRNGRIAEAGGQHLLDCIECGSCAYVCPAYINLVHWLRYGKSEIIRSRKQAG